MPMAFHRGRRYAPGRYRFGVLRDVGVELFQAVKGLIFSPQLGEGPPARYRAVPELCRVGDLDFAFVFRFGQILPAFLARQIFLFQALGIDAEAEDADVHRRRVAVSASPDRGTAPSPA